MLESRGQPMPLDYVPMRWDEVEVEAPDVSDMATLAALAAMSGNAYTAPTDDASWYDIGGRFNLSDSFGWKADGLRGHVFATPDNSTVVIAVKVRGSGAHRLNLKGTSAGPLGGGGSTGPSDKRNGTRADSATLKRQTTCCSACGGTRLAL